MAWKLPPAAAPVKAAPPDPPAPALTTARTRPDYARAMRWTAALLALALLPPAAGAATPVRVLVVGNSYADGTDNLLPGFFDAASGFTLALKSYTPGGYQLRQHLADPTLLQDIRTGRYDVVILQEQSQTPAVAYLDYRQSGAPEPFAAYAQRRVDQNGIDPFPGGNQFDELLENFWGGAHGLADLVLTTTTARVLLFGHWARHPGDTAFLPVFPGSNGADRAAAMLDHQSRAFAALAARLGDRAAVVPIGDAWARSYAARPELMLHAADFSHGNTAGYYLAAAGLFEAITGRSALDHSYTGGLPADDARHLRAAATLATEQSTSVVWTTKRDVLLAAWPGRAPLTYQWQAANSPAGEWMDAGPPVTGANEMIAFDALDAAPPQRSLRMLARP